MTSENEAGKTEKKAFFDRVQALRKQATEEIGKLQRKTAAEIIEIRERTEGLISSEASPMGLAENEDSFNNFDNFNDWNDFDNFDDFNDFNDQSS